jgi:tRNA threonylcarbamoyladenosine biosynthesis protein TsaE
MAFSEKFEVISQSLQETRKFARDLALALTKFVIKDQGLILALEGELGAGKTAFVQGFAKALKIKEKIFSPTFLLMRKFSLPSKNSVFFKNFYHLDCYRLQKASELEKLGAVEVLKNPQNIVLIEWPNRIKSILPSKVLWLKFKILKPNQRKITISWIINGKSKPKNLSFN